MTEDGANEEELIYSDIFDDDEIVDPPTELELIEWTQPEADPFGD